MSPEQEIVYFIRSGRRGPVKVGKATGNPQARVAELQCGNPETLYLLGVTPGGLELEREIHQRLKAYRLRGEWFKPTRQVMEVLKEYASFAPREHPTDRSFVVSADAVCCEVCGTMLRQAWRDDPSKSRTCTACDEFAAFRASGETL